VVAALTLCVLVAGCGHTQLVGANRTLHLAMTEYRLAPQRVQAPPGRLTIIVRNNGLLTHNLAVTRGGVSTGTTQPIPPGHAARLTLRVRRGSYQMLSTMLSDQDLGLYGTLVIR
jgi:hypothetical protein